MYDAWYMCRYAPGLYTSKHAKKGRLGKKGASALSSDIARVQTCKDLAMADDQSLFAYTLNQLDQHTTVAGCCASIAVLQVCIFHTDHSGETRLALHMSG